MKKMIIAPSILSADFSNLDKEIQLAENSGAKFLHFDVMDGHFVNNISFGIPVLKSIAKTHHMVNDVHIMINNPDKYAIEFVKNGADILTFHYEACDNPKMIHEIIHDIHAAGARAGLSIKPGTDVKNVDEFLNHLDLVLIMSVEPGFGGQKFMDNSLEKIRYLRERIDRFNLNCLIEVDGGINEETAKLCKEAGADVLVAGSYLFGHEDFKKRLEDII